MEICALEGETRMEHALRGYADCVLRISEAHRKVYPIWLEWYALARTSVVFFFE
jgi:hypothetical protein